MPGSEQERIDAAVQAATERIEIAAQLEAIGKSQEAILEGQRLQVETNTEMKVNQARIFTRLDSMEKRLTSHSKRMDEIESGERNRGLVSGGVSGVGGAGLLYVAIEAIKKLNGG